MRRLSRLEMMFGTASVRGLGSCRVAVFGVGGVGGYVVEVLARSGVGAIDLIDGDEVDETNINRQIIALTSTVGESKVAVAERRIKAINPDCVVTSHKMFYLPQNADNLNFSEWDYVVDCIDTVTSKIDIVKRCKAVGVPVLTCLGAANKVDPMAFEVGDLFSTSVDPLARVMRKKLRALGISGVKCVFSREQPLRPVEPQRDERKGRDIPSSNAWVPAAEGLLAGSVVVRSLLAGEKK